MAAAVISTKTISTTAAAPGRRLDRNSEIAISGPNSPTAPSAMTAVPKGVRSSPASRSIGIRVPSAVLVNATPMNTPAATVGASRIPMTTPDASEITQPRADLLSGRPRIRSKSISLPARKNSMASPKSASAEVKSLGCTQPRMAGPNTSPRTISKTTSGILISLDTLEDNNGASTASSAIPKTDAVTAKFIPRPLLEWDHAKAHRAFPRSLARSSHPPNSVVGCVQILGSCRRLRRPVARECRARRPVAVRWW